LNISRLVGASNPEEIRYHRRFMAPADENRRAATAGPAGAQRLAIVLANYNQAAHLAASVERLQATCSLLRLETQLILVDDGSTDATWRESLALAARYPNIRLHRQPENLGRGAAVAAGVRMAETDLVGTLDTDLEVPPHYVLPLVERIEAGADLAIAHRRYPLPLGVSRTWQLGRWVAHKGYRQLTRAALRTPIDTLSGCKVLRRDRLIPVIDAIRDQRWFWNTELVVRARRAGLRVAEVDAFCPGKAEGSSTVDAVRETIAHLYWVARLRRELDRAGDGARAGRGSKRFLRVPR
jgi:glycosyltransferase involved in cell wall biosynthesis